MESPHYQFNLCKICSDYLSFLILVLFLFFFLISLPTDLSIFIDSSREIALIFLISSICFSISCGLVFYCLGLIWCSFIFFLHALALICFFFFFFIFWFLNWKLRSFLLNLSTYVIEELSKIPSNVPIAAHHKFWYFLFSFSFSSEYCLLLSDSFFDQ